MPQDISVEINKFLEGISYLNIEGKSKLPIVATPWDDIPITEEEKNLVLGELRRQKYEVLERRKRNQERQQRIDESKRIWSATETGKYAERMTREKFGFSSIVGDGKPEFLWNEEMMRLLSLYFSNSKLFEETGYSLSKGLCLMGNIGVGKTLLMHIFSRNSRQCYNIVSCRDIAAEYAQDGFTYIDRYFNVIPGGNDPRTFYQDQVGICFDDLGTETQKKNYGNQLNVMEEIILNRYDKKYVMPFNLTHLTTNLSPDEILTNYGSRVSSRFKEMFNILVLDGADKRK